MQKVPYVTNYLTEHTADDAFASFSGYRATGGYETLRKTLRERTPSDVIVTITRSGLQGRGGAGFGTGLKWSYMPEDSKREKLLVCNADESEPGSFKDRLLLERAPHMVIEGILIAAWAIGAHKTFIYIRGEYAAAARQLARAIVEARAAGFLGENILDSSFDHEIVLQRGGGAYICGEETGLLESLEGKRGQPRKKPPYPAQVGAFGLPTTVNNVETFCHVPHILARGTAWFRDVGTENSPGTTLFGVSGHVRRPGLYELPLGTPLDEIVFEHARGVPDDRAVKGVIPGGVSMPILPADQLGVPMANEFLKARGTQLGTGGVIVMDESTCMVRVACVVSEFFRDESCGQCTQCREGTSWINRIVARIERGGGVPEDLEVLADVASKMEGQTICSFSDAAAWPIQGLLRHFRDDFTDHLRDRKCSLSGFEL